MPKPDSQITFFACGSDAACGDVVGLEAQWLLDMIAEDEWRQKGREGEAPGVIAAERAGRGCVLCGDEEAPTIDGTCPGCRGPVGDVVDELDFGGYADRSGFMWA